MDYIMLNVRYVAHALEFYTKMLGLEPIRVEDFDSGKKASLVQELMIGL